MVVVWYNIAMSKVTISKEEYTRLKKHSEAYKKLAIRFFETATKDTVDEVVQNFRQTGLYTEGFLSDMKKGLSQSSYLLNGN